LTHLFRDSELTPYSFTGNRSTMASFVDVMTLAVTNGTLCLEHSELARIIIRRVELMARLKLAPC
jgi:hypothetical protein